MYTASPETNYTDRPLPTEVTSIASAKAKLISKMVTFANSHRGEDFAGVTPQSEHTQYSDNPAEIQVLNPVSKQIEFHQASRRAHRPKGGKSPIDYSLVETLADLQLLCKRQQYDEALPLYFRLRSFTA